MICFSLAWVGLVSLGSVCYVLGLVCLAWVVSWGQSEVAARSALCSVTFALLAPLNLCCCRCCCFCLLCGGLWLFGDDPYCSSSSPPTSLPLSPFFSPSPLSLWLCLMLIRFGSWIKPELQNWLPTLDSSALNLTLPRSTSSSGCWQLLKQHMPSGLSPPFPSTTLPALHSHCANSDCTHSACCSCIYVRASRLRNMPNKPRYISAKSKNKHRAMKYNICMAFPSLHVCVCAHTYVCHYSCGSWRRLFLFGRAKISWTLQAIKTSALPEFLARFPLAHVGGWLAA